MQRTPVALLSGSAASAASELSIVSVAEMETCRLLVPASSNEALKSGAEGPHSAVALTGKAKYESPGAGSSVVNPDSLLMNSAGLSRGLCQYSTFVRLA